MLGVDRIAAGEVSGSEQTPTTGYHAPVANRFRVEAPFSPAGDQPAAIEELSEAIRGGERFTTLLGITGSGKSATIAWTIENLQRPTLVIAPNKSLAAQLANELRSDRKSVV